VVDDVSDREALVAACETGRRRALLAGHPEDDVVDLLGLVLEAAGSALASATLRGVVAARAVRVLCPACKEPLPQSGAAVGSPVAFSARGCEACGLTGFRGSRTLAQVWVPGPESRRLLRLGPSQDLFERVAREAGPSWRDQGQVLIENGLVSPDELSRVADGR
jgi:general secretion pathway protein E